MPQLGMSMQEGTVVDWVAPVDSPLEKGQVILIIESEKAEVEIEATASGYFRHIYVEAGETVACGTLLGVSTETADEALDIDAFLAANPPPAVARPSSQAPAPVQTTPVARPNRPVSVGPAPATPAARKRAKQLDVDLTRVPGSGPGGRITREDVEAWEERRRSLVEVAAGVSLDVPSQGPENGEPVFLLPGFGTDISVFARQIPELAKSYLVRGVNPRGVSGSDAPELDQYEVSQAAADVAALVQEPSHIVGTSLGAAVAIEFALAYPEKVRSLALIAPFVAADPRLVSVTDSWVQLAANVDAETLATALLPWFFSSDFLADRDARERTRRGLASTLSRASAATLHRTAAGLRNWSGSRSADLGKLAIPTLVIGAGEDLLTPDGRDIADAIPDAHFISIEGAGHAVGLEAAEHVNEILLAHLGAAGSTPTP